MLVHGWCMASTVWKYQFDGLSGVYHDPIRFVAPDLRGHGRSSGGGGHLTFDSFSRDLVDLFVELNLTNVVLVGWSLGAQVALQACAELSGRIAGMVLVSGTPRFTASDDFSYGLAASESSGMRLKVQRNMQRARDGFFTRMFAANELESSVAEAEIRQMLSTIPLPETAAALDSLDALAHADMRHLLSAITIPTLIVNGALDRVCLPQASRYLQTHIPNAEQTVFTACGHAPFLTHSSDFNREIIRFIRSVCERDA